MTASGADGTLDNVRDQTQADLTMSTEIDHKGATKAR
jgi:hypothetical protein